ncbi:MAG: hypothetical protein FWD52_06650 [Candidatus Bathyarchaeota archaeon]|nr:hypothetical protein [Candidatus Termiticorpusculum sp.]
MSINDESKFEFHISRRTVLGVSLFVVLLLSLVFIGTFMMGSRGVSLENAIHVKTENELRSTINNAFYRGSVVIALSNDISLSRSSLTIPANKDITLTSSKTIGCYKLIGADGESTITVVEDGVLKIDGIIVTHESGKEGSGVTVESGGTLIVYSGEISGNTVRGVGMPILIGGYSREGGGVYNSGVFEMYGGKISGNLASVGNGGGVYNTGTFKLSGGEISNNNATTTTFTDSEICGYGGGVCNTGTFAMSSGKIVRNMASGGGGVRNYGTFELSGGEITYNTASGGGGVYSYNGVFTMLGGTISGNNAYYRGGGVYVHWGSTFDRQDGMISGNTITNEEGEGKDVYNNGSIGGSPGGNSGSGSGDNSSEQTNGNGDGLSMVEGFSLREVVILCIGVVGVTLAVVMAVLFFTSKKRIVVEEKRGRFIVEG